MTKQHTAALEAPGVTVAHEPGQNTLPLPIRVVSWTLQLAAVVILGQTLFFKFVGAPETVALFEVVGAEPLGRYGAGMLELLAVVLLLAPRTAALGALVSLAAITGAIGAHLTRLGVSIDPVALGKPALEPLAGPGLFTMALAVLGASLGVLAIRRRTLPLIGDRLP